jgi:hypothetical protein
VKLIEGCNEGCDDGALLSVGTVVGFLDRNNEGAADGSLHGEEGIRGMARHELKQKI